MEQPGFDRERVRQYLEKLVKAPVQDKVVRSLTVNPLYHGSSKMTISVGHNAANLEPGASIQMVLAIYESKSFLVVTANRGNMQGLPYFFTRQEVVRADSGD